MLETYDLLEKNGVIDAVVNAIPEDEYNAFVAYCQEVTGDYDKYKNSILGIVERFVGEIPEKLDTINAAMSNFKTEDLKSIQDIIGKFGGAPSAVTNEILGQN